MSIQALRLPKNIKTLNDTIFRIKSKGFLVPPPPSLDITPHLMTKRQIAKKILLVTGGVISATGDIIQTTTQATQVTITNANVLGANISENNIATNKDLQFSANAASMLGRAITPETAHFIIYGKFKRDENGNLIDNEVVDPDCVFRKLAMPEEHPTISEIGVMITKVTKALKMLGVKQLDLLDEIAQAMISIPASIVAISSSLAILPPGAGLPVAFAAFQSIISTIMNLVSKIADLSDIMEPFNFMPLLIKAQKIDAVIGVINIQILAINTILLTIEGLTKIIPKVPSPPGQGGTPPDPIKVEGEAYPSEVKKNKVTDVKLSARATNGSWNFDYSWTGPGGFKSNEKEFTLSINTNKTLKYKVTATDKEDKSNKDTTEVKIEVD